MSQQVYEYTLYVKGKFGRNRTIKFEGFKLAKEQEQPLTDEVVLKLAREKMQEIKLKTPYTAKACEQPMTVKKEDGWTSMTFRLFSDRVIFQEAVSG